MAAISLRKTLEGKLKPTGTDRNLKRCPQNQSIAGLAFFVDSLTVVGDNSPKFEPRLVDEGLQVLDVIADNGMGPFCPIVFPLTSSLLRINRAC
jgi:hypothetical protein